MTPLANSIRSWLKGEPTQLNGAAQHDRARIRLREHIDDILLQNFLSRSITAEQHAAVIEHLHVCDVCREAIAVVLLADEDPTAAAELVVERQKRATDNESWQRRALRWSAVVVLALILVGAVLLVPKASDPDSSIGSLLGSSSSEDDSSGTSFGDFMSGKLSEDKQPVERPAPRRHGRQVQPGWDTGPAPYAGNVAASAPFIEIDMPGSSTSASEDKGWFGVSDKSAATSSAPAVPPQTEGGEPDRNSGTAAPRARPLAARRLIVSRDGRLLRTMNGGVSWQTITLAPNVSFRSLALSGTTIWAAGNGGALYRSLDATEHWQQVIVHQHGQPVVADIKNIRFTDPQHGDFNTADGQHWITVDGGQKWILSR